MENYDAIDKALEVKAEIEQRIKPKKKVVKKKVVRRKKGD